MMPANRVSPQFDPTRLPRGFETCEWYESTSTWRIVTIAFASLATIATLAKRYQSLLFTPGSVTAKRVLSASIPLAAFSTAVAIVSALRVIFPHKNCTEVRLKLKAALNTPSERERSAVELRKKYPENVLSNEEIEGFLQPSLDKFKGVFSSFYYMEFIDKHTLEVYRLLSPANQAVLREAFLKLNDHCSINIILREPESRVFGIQKEELVARKIEKWQAKYQTYEDFRIGIGSENIGDVLRTLSPKLKAQVKREIVLTVSKRHLHLYSADLTALSTTEEEILQSRLEEWKKTPFTDPDFPLQDEFCETARENGELTAKVIKETSHLPIRTIAEKYPILFNERVLTAESKIEGGLTVRERVENEASKCATFEEFTLPICSSSIFSPIWDIIDPNNSCLQQLAVDFVKRHVDVFLKYREDYDRNILPPWWHTDQIFRYGLLPQSLKELHPQIVQAIENAKENLNEKRLAFDAACMVCYSAASSNDSKLMLSLTEAKTNLATETAEAKDQVLAACDVYLKETQSKDAALTEANHATA